MIFSQSAIRISGVIFSKLTIILFLFFCFSAPRPELVEDAVVPSPGPQQQQQNLNHTPVYNRTKVLGILTTTPSSSSSSSGYMTSHSNQGLTPRSSSSLPVEIMSVYHSSGGAVSNSGGVDHDYGFISVNNSSSGLTPITPSPSVGRQGARPLFVTPGSEGYSNRSRVVHGSGGSKSLQPVKVGY
jgi:hypothetical protein